VSGIRRGVACLAAGLLLASCATRPPQPARVTGRVVHEGRGIPRALVQAYPKAEQDRSTPPVAEVPSGEDGAFDLRLPAGRYWIWAKATLQEGAREVRLVGAAVPNPVEPGPGGTAAVTIELANPGGFSTSAGAEGAGVRGRVGGAAPGERVSVAVYRGRSARPVGPGFAAAVEPDAAGGFKVNLAPGVYTVAVRVRTSGDDFGPPAPTDRVAVRPAEVAAAGYTDLGELRLAPIDAALWKRITASLGESATGIEGVVRDAQGRPVEGVRVLAFRDGRMAGKPVALSPATGADGAYSVRLPEGGAFFLGARSRLGGPASPGEKVGQNRGAEGSGVVVAAGSVVKGQDIVVEEVW
jgi:hypothetical protein